MMHYPPDRRRRRRRRRCKWILLLAVVTVLTYSQWQSLSKLNLTELATTTTITAPPEYLHICFLTSVYGQWAIHADKLQDVQHDLPFYNHPHVHFFVWTNLPKLPANGWTKVLELYQGLPFQRYITQSRHIKFWAWNNTRIVQHCQVVFYMDSIGHIVGSFQEFQSVAQQIYNSPQGHAQYLHRGGGGAWGELRRIEVFHKDVPENIQATKAWLQQQPDFRPPSHHNCTLYENRYIGYAVGRPTTFAEAVTQCFWPRYSRELDSWRDQPLWCYCLDRYNITPIPLLHTKLWKLDISRMGGGGRGHKYKSLDDAKIKQKKTTG